MRCRRYLPLAAIAAAVSLPGCAPYDEPAYSYYLVPCTPGAPLSQSVTPLPPGGAPPAGLAAPGANQCIAAVPNYAPQDLYGGYYPGYGPGFYDYGFGSPFFAPSGVFAFGGGRFRHHDRDHDHDRDRDHDRGAHISHGMNGGDGHGMHAGAAPGGGHAGGGHSGGGHGGGGGGGSGHRS